MTSLLVPICYYLKKKISHFLVISVVISFTSCTNITKEEAAVWGAMGGAVLGSIIGHQSGESESGAQMGAAIGAIAGYGGGYAAEKARIAKEQEKVSAAIAYQTEMAKLAKLEEEAARNRKKQLEQELATVVSAGDRDQIKSEIAQNEAKLEAKKKERKHALNQTSELEKAKARLAQAEAEIEALEREATR